MGAVFSSWNSLGASERLLKLAAVQDINLKPRGEPEARTRSVRLDGLRVRECGGTNNHRPVVTGDAPPKVLSKGSNKNNRNVAVVMGKNEEKRKFN